MYANNLKLIGLIKWRHKSLSMETLMAAIEWARELSYYCLRGCLVLLSLNYVPSSICDNNSLTIHYCRVLTFCRNNHNPR